MVIAEECHAIIRTTRAGPVFILALKGEISAQAPWGLGEALLADSDTTDRLRPAQC